MSDPSWNMLSTSAFGPLLRGRSTSPRHNMRISIECDAHICENMTIDDENTAHESKHQRVALRVKGSSSPTKPLEERGTSLKAVAHRVSYSDARTSARSCSMVRRTMRMIA